MTQHKDEALLQEISSQLARIGADKMDVAIPSSKAPTGRIVASPWQRPAAGTTVSVLAYDKQGELYVAMGIQRNEFSLCAGYMESELPQANFTDIPPGHSRINAQTGALVPADKNLKATAVREVKEELDIDITPGNLIPLGDWSDLEHNERKIHTANLGFAVILPGTKEQYDDLKVTDFEFADDLTKPKWYNIRDIATNHGKAAIKGSPIRDIHVEMLEKAVTEANNKKITEVSDDVWDSQDAVRKRYGQKVTSLIGKEKAEEVLQTKFGNKPHTSLGAEARQYQANIIQTANELTQRALTPKSERQQKPFEFSL